MLNFTEYKLVQHCVTL